MNIYFYTRQTFAIALLLLLCGCSNNRAQSVDSTANVSQIAQQLSNNQDKQALWSEFQAWQGTPYKYGGTTKQGVDCSGFVQSVFYTAEKKVLPRTTQHQARRGYKVKYEEAEIGDLVFFKTSYKDRHVGIYLGNKSFMHASTSKGVIISRLDNPYWASVFWQFRRVD